LQNQAEIYKSYSLPHRFAAAFLAISARRAGDIFAARALPPRDPSSAAADLAESGNSSSSSPVAIRMTLTALPITSARRFSPRGPLGIAALFAQFGARDLGTADGDPRSENASP
jgi:hypothetical protein